MGNRIRIGGKSSRVRAGLRIFGDDLDPDAVSQQLGCPPTGSFRKGEIESKPNARDVRIAKTGKWFLELGDSEELEVVVKALLAKLTPDLAVWSDLISSYDVDIFCGVFFESENNGNGGFILSPQLMLALSERGLKIGFDIYYP